jgi:hypothetical protein
MGNSWQSPVTGEPSWGTPHTHYKANVVSTNPADTNWHEVDLSAEVPMGSKGVMLTFSMQETAGVVRTLSISNADTGNVFCNLTNVSSAVGCGQGICPLSSTRTIWWKVDNADVDSVVVNLTGYFI